MTQPLRWFWLAVLAAHGTVAVAFGLLMPGGFPATSLLFWVNRVLPWIVLAVVLAGRFVQSKCRGDIAAALLVVFPSIWLAAALGAVIVFPITFHWLWLAPAGVGVMLALAWWRAFPSVRFIHPSIIVAAILAGAVGILLPISQRASAPATTPLNVSMNSLSSNETISRGAIRLSGDITVQPVEGSITFAAGRHFLGIQPVLTFVSRSPDGCWTLVADKRTRNGPPREVIKVDSSPDTARMLLRDDCDSVLNVQRSADSVVAIESITRLSQPIYSHLNTFTELTLTGHQKLFIEFSPCVGKRIEITPADYPFGRPHRCAYVDANGDFHVVEARSAEKGPFKILAAGRLPRESPLVMTFYDEDHPLWRITLSDFAAQASVALSPTAGFGLPQNAVEFSCEGESSKSAVGVYITLAGTSVGRGYQSVGHAAGVYRNRVNVERLLWNDQAAVKSPR